MKCWQLLSRSELCDNNTVLGLKPAYIWHGLISVLLAASRYSQSHGQASTGWQQFWSPELLPESGHAYVGIQTSATSSVYTLHVMCNGQVWQNTCLLLIPSSLAVYGRFLYFS